MFNFNIFGKCKPIYRINSHIFFYMDIKEQLMTENSKSNAEYIANSIGNNREKYNSLWEIVKSESVTLSTRAAWVFEIISIKHSDIFESIISEVIYLLSKIKNRSVRRHLLKILSYKNIPAADLGNLFDCCLNWVESPSEPVAVKVHCLQILYNISEIENDLKPELIAIISNQMERESSGFKARGQMLLEKLNNEQSFISY